MKKSLLRRIIPLVFLAFLIAGLPSPAQARPLADGDLPCQIFPANNIWNTRVDSLPVHARSAAYIGSIGSATHLHPDFGSGLWEGKTMGIPFNIVPGSQEKVGVSFYYPDESDPGLYPIPDRTVVNIEGGDVDGCEGDCHILVLDSVTCKLYEVYDAHPNPDGTWDAGSGAIFDLNANALRPNTWTSSDAAGLPIFPGLIRYDEVKSGVINHAIRFTVSRSQHAYVWPARHYASSNTSASLPPMGQRFRLKAGYNLSGFSDDMKVILQAMKTYGIIVADNGSNWYIGGAPDERWDNDVLHEIDRVKGSDFEAVDASALMLDPNSGAARAAPLPPAPAKPKLSRPRSKEPVTSFRPTFSWKTVSTAQGYDIQVSPAKDFSSITFQDSAAGGSYLPAAELPNAGIYYWRVRAWSDREGEHVNSAWTKPWSFTTPAMVSGVVSQTPGGEPLAGITVRLEGTALSAVTDSQGRYAIRGVKTGARSFTASDETHYGTKRMAAKKGIHYTLNFRLAARQPILPPGEGKLYHGVYPGGITGEEDDITLADLHSYEAAAGKTAAWMYFSNNWYRSRTFPLDTAAWVRTAGSVPYIRLMLRSTSEQTTRADRTFTLARILKGSFDKDIRAWGQAAREFGSPLIVEYGTEVNGDWFPWNGKYAGGGRANKYGDHALPDGPERFVNAYRRIIRLVREEGAANVTWVFHANWDSQPQDAWNSPQNYYPGDAWVDWIGVSAYGAQTPLEDSCEVFRDEMDAAYPVLSALSADKPIILAEFGAAKDNPHCDQASWADAALADLTAGRWPRIMGFSWWNETWQNDENPAHDTTMRLQDNPDLAEVFQNRVGGSADVLGRLEFGP